MDTPPSALELRTSPPRAWRGRDIARRYPASSPYSDTVDTPALPIRIVHTALACEPEPPPSDAGPPALRGEALARALEALR